MTNKLPVLKDTENEVFMELQQLGVTPVVKRYCATCQHFNRSYVGLEYSKCRVKHNEFCSSVNKNYDCIHWTEGKSNDSAIIPIILMIIISFAVGAFVF